MAVAVAAVAVAAAAAAAAATACCCHFVVLFVGLVETEHVAGIDTTISCQQVQYMRTVLSGRLLAVLVVVVVVVAVLVVGGDFSS